MSISQKFFHWSLAVFLIVSTYFNWRLPPNFQGDVVMYGYALQELFFRYGVIWVWAAALFLKPVREVTLKDLGVFLIYVLFVSSMVSFDLRQRSQILNLFLGILFYKTVMEHFDFRFLKNVVCVFFWILFTNLIFCVLQHYNMDPIHKALGGIQGFPQLVGLMRLSEHLGTLCAVLTPALAILSPVLILVALPLLWFSKTSAAVAALIASFTFLLARRKGFKWAGWFLLVSFFAGAAYVLKVDMPGGNFHYRFIVWMMGLRELLTTSMYFGLGIGSWYTWAPQTGQLTSPEPLTWLWAHNEYLQVLFELGVAGFVILILFIKNRFKDFERVKSDYDTDCLFASFIGILIISVLHFPFHLGRFAALVVFIPACLHAKMIEDSHV